MNADRRSFLKMFGGGVVASATMVEAGMFAEFMSWLQRKPVWSIPARPQFGYHLSATQLSTVIWYDKQFIENLKRNVTFEKFGVLRPLQPWRGQKMEWNIDGKKSKWD